MAEKKEKKIEAASDAKAEEKKDPTAKDLCLQDIGKVLEDYNCLPEETMVFTKDGNHSLVRVVGNLVTGETAEDRDSRTQKCAEALKEVMEERRFDWFVASTVQKGRIPTLSLDIVPLPEEAPKMDPAED